MRRKKMRMCNHCGGIDLTMEYDDKNNLTFYCRDCGYFIEKYYNVVPIVEHIVGKGVVVTFNYKDEKDE